MIGLHWKRVESVSNSSDCEDDAPHDAHTDTYNLDKNNKENKDNNNIAAPFSNLRLEHNTYKSENILFRGTYITIYNLLHIHTVHTYILHILYKNTLIRTDIIVQYILVRICVLYVCI